MNENEIKSKSSPVLALSKHYNANQIDTYNLAHYHVFNSDKPIELCQRGMTAMTNIIRDHGDETFKKINENLVLVASMRK